jgi:hypothetical protein
VQNDFVCFQRPTLWLQIGIGQWIDYRLANSPRGFMTRGQAWPGISDATYRAGCRNADLEQTKFFPIRMQTVGFGIDCNAIGRFDLLN